MRMQTSSVLLAACALSACALVGKVQGGFGGGGSSGASGGASGASGSSSGESSPLASLASIGGGGGGAYCGKKHYSKYTANELHAWFDDAAKGRHELHFVVKLHQALCSGDTPGSDRPEIEKMRQTVLAELGLTDGDTRDIAPLLDLDMTDTMPTYFRYTTEVPSTKGEAKAASASPIDQLYVLHAVNTWRYETTWIADMWGDAITESARASYVNQCLHNVHGHNLSEDAVSFAMCSDDAAHLDRAKFAQELAPLAPGLRFAAKYELGLLSMHIANVEHSFAKDPNLAKIAIEQPRKIGDDWRAFGKANKALLDRVRAIETAWIDNEGEAPEDCRTKLADDWKRAVAAVKVEKTSAPSLGVAATSRHGYLVSVGMARCTAKRAGYAGLSAMVGEALDRAPLGRGPRTQALEVAINELSKASKKFTPPRMESVDVSFLPMRQSNGHTARFWAHTVASIERHGDKVKMNFKKEKVDYPVCTREEPTGNWIIHGDKLEREIHCVALESRSMMEDVNPVEMPAEIGAWVKPGNAVVLGDNEFPIEIWTDVHQTKLIGLYGTNRG